MKFPKLVRKSREELVKCDGDGLSESLLPEARNFLEEGFQNLFVEVSSFLVCSLFPTPLADSLNVSLE